MVRKRISETALRKCRTCGLEAHEERELELFVKQKTGPYGRATECKQCHKTYYHIKKDEWNLKRNEKMRKIRKNLIDYLGAKCAGCGTEDIRVLETHAPNGHEYPKNNRNADTNWIERDKLVILCANCHLIAHSNNE
jgi:5-methylcytosine-specific restriction endonuclease McrA